MAQDLEKQEIQYAEQNSRHEGPFKDPDLTDQSEILHETHTENPVSGEQESDVFSELLSGLGDHAGFIVGPYHVMDLPYIFIDDGFHFYWNSEQVEATKEYTIDHGHVVRVEDHQPPALDLSVTNLVAFQWIAIIILAFVFNKASKRYKKEPGTAPKGFQNMIESVIVYVRDQIVNPNISSHGAAQRLLPYFIALFFFILVMNLLGLIPGGHTATGALGTTFGLALTAFIVIQITAIREIGLGGWFHHLLGGAPWWLFFIMIPIEIIGMFVKPFALTIRLFANMTAGHVILFALVGFIFYFQSLAISPAIVGFSVFILFLELLVAFIQAYIFTMLTAIFVGLAVGEHAEHAME
ncbi:MAG: F0F1 ATP synthase subunit A [Bacteroidota bacterium]